MMTFKQFLIEKNWYKAYKTHTRIEKSMGNHAWKFRHPAAVAVAGGIAAGVAAGTPEGLAMAGVSAVGSAASLIDHVSDIRRIKKKLDREDKAKGR